MFAAVGIEIFSHSESRLISIRIDTRHDLEGDKYMHYALTCGHMAGGHKLGAR
jgi:hypothetical protein